MQKLLVSCLLFSSYISAVTQNSRSNVKDYSSSSQTLPKVNTILNKNKEASSNLHKKKFKKSTTKSKSSHVKKNKNSVNGNSKRDDFDGHRTKHRIIIIAVAIISAVLLAAWIIIKTCFRKKYLKQKSSSTLVVDNVRAQQAIVLSEKNLKVRTPKTNIEPPQQLGDVKNPRDELRVEYFTAPSKRRLDHEDLKKFYKQQKEMINR